ncbi:cytochrome P450 [Elsinoe ampelina]|uniref:Cytochrome P450 n=1 Tax=Elsinoe ampelina TaxID=302913 RepID=A0A6A6GPD8_9PEZI|nr:cytochrome P450 [Elsinoe ampelina]
MWSLLTTAVTALLALYYGSFILRFCINYFQGRKSGFYTVLIPFAPAHPVWLIGAGILREFLQKTFKGRLWDWLVLTIGPFEHEVKRRPFFEKKTKSYLLVTAGENELWTSDPEVVLDVLKRPKDFSQQDVSNLILGYMGPSLITSDGEVWAKQRKIIASIVNERVSKLVFEESGRQADFLVDELRTVNSEDRDATMPSMDGLKKIAINVLSRAGYGIPKSWEDGDVPSDSVSRGGKYHLDFMSSVKYMIDYLVVGAFISPRLLTNMPNWVKGASEMHNIGHAVNEYAHHARAKIAEERAIQASSKTQLVRASLLAHLVLNSGDAASVNQKAISLTEPEMFGNLWVFTSAGYDTTANTLQFATILLAAYPKWQDWLFSESVRLLPSGTTSDLDYASTYTRATRHLALMNETLRLFPPVPHNAKMNKSGKYQTITTKTATYHIPPKTNIFPCFLALHLEPTTQDEYLFRPARWIVQSSTEAGETEQLFKPPQGHFLPFSTGPRVCPGYKMAQVEFVSVMLTLLRRFKVEAVKRVINGKEETQEEAAQRLWEMMHDLRQGLTIGIKRIHETGLRFVEREI